MKKCAKCGLDKPIVFFYIDRQGKASARCRQCHGVEFRVCRMCRRVFEARHGRVLCSDECRHKWRPRTRIACIACAREFDVDHLSRRYCSRACKVTAQTTGRCVIRKTIPKARSAQSLIGYHVRAGNIVRPQRCEACGLDGRKIEAAHYNYDEPLRVRWFADRATSAGTSVSLRVRLLSSARSTDRSYTPVPQPGLDC